VSREGYGTEGILVLEHKDAEKILENLQFQH
jgi:hypothetical protein